MWVEIIGLPGVGKTTTIERSLPFIAKTHAIVKSNAPGIMHRLYAKYIYITRYKGRFDNRQLEKKLAYRTGLRLWIKKTDNVLFYDSGILQVIIEHLIANNFTDMKKILAVIRNLPVCDTVIFFKDDIADIVDREYMRQSRCFDLSREELRKRYLLAQDVMENEMPAQALNIQAIKIAAFTPATWAQIAGRGGQ